MRSRRIPTPCSLPASSQGISSLPQTNVAARCRRPPKCCRSRVGWRTSIRRYAMNLPPRDHQNRSGACHHRSLSVRCAGVHANHLSWLRRNQADATGQHVNPFRIAQGGIFQTQRVVHLGFFGEFTLGRFDLVPVLDGLEVLPGIGKDQQEQTSQRGAKLLHLAIAPRIFHFYQTRIVDRFGKVNLGCTCPKRSPLCHRNRTANCRRCCCHYAAPMKMCSPSVAGICIAKIACSSCSMTISQAFCSTRSTIAIKSLIIVPVCISHYLKLDSYHGTRKTDLGPNSNL